MAFTPNLDMLNASQRALWPELGDTPPAEVRARLVRAADAVDVTRLPVLTPSKPESGESL